MKNNYYTMLNEGFDKVLLEAQQVVIDFKNIFGSDTYEQFKSIKQRLRNPENDISNWVKRYNEEGDDVIEELHSLLDSVLGTKRDVEGKIIPEPADTKVKVAENDSYVVYYVDEVSDMIDLAMTKVDGFAGGYWCIAGRYQLGYDAEQLGIEKDDAVKVSQAEHFFPQYLGGDYNAYFVCMPKDGSCGKHCLCFKSSETCDDWSSDDERNGFEDGFSYIPEFEYDNYHFKGEASIQEEDDDMDWEEEPEVEEGPAEWEDENGHVWHGYRPPMPQDPVMMTIEDPDSFEFAVQDRDEVIKAFADKGFEGVEFVEEIPGTPVFIVKFVVEPEHQEFEMEDGEVYSRDLPGERYTPFVFYPGQGGGPLLSGPRDGKLVAHRTLDGAKAPFVRDFQANNIRRNGEEPEEHREVEEESLKEGYYYFEYKVEESCKLKEGIAYYYIFVGNEEVCDYIGEPLHFDSEEEAEEYALEELELLPGDFDICARHDWDFSGKGLQD